MIVLEKKDLQSPIRRATVISSNKGTFNYENWYKERFGLPNLAIGESRNEYDDISSSDDSDFYQDLKQNLPQRRQNVLHFIPSAQIKILKGTAGRLKIRFLFEQKNQSDIFAAINSRIRIWLYIPKFSSRKLIF